MLDKSKIEEIVNQCIEGTDKFLVGINVSSSNIVDVYVDGDHGISIDECADISRSIELSISRDIEDYELRVSSPGLDKPFKLIRQYRKYLDREIEVVQSNGNKINGILKSVTEAGFSLERKKSKKAKETVCEDYLFDDIKGARPYVRV